MLLFDASCQICGASPFSEPMVDQKETLGLWFWWETRCRLLILSMQALMRSNLGFGGGAATPHQPLGVDQGVKILAIQLQAAHCKGSKNQP